ncbi:hypothetical protein Ancab_031676 [Ancistrocladus abbreviatus]
MPGKKRENNLLKGSQSDDLALYCNNDPGNDGMDETPKVIKMQDQSVKEVKQQSSISVLAMEICMRWPGHKDCPKRGERQ